MFLQLLVLLLLFLLSIILYFNYDANKKENYYKRKGILFLGTTPQKLCNLLITRKFESMTENLLESYNKIKQESKRFAIEIQFTSKSFIVTDLNLIKQITVKDFDHFVDKRSFGQSKHDTLLSKMLITIKGDEWKNLRSKMSPTFTTGKIRQMFQIFDESGKKMVKYIQQDIVQGSTSVIDVQEGYSKFTMDVVASAAFGLDSEAFNQKEPSIFEKMGSKFTFQLNLITILKFVVLTASPKLGDLLGFAVLDREAQDFFSKVIKDTIKYRLNTKEKRNDFLQLMLEVRDGQLKNVEEAELGDFEKDAVIRVQKDEGTTGSKVALDDDDIVAQSVLFILAGYDTIIAAHLFSVYNLAVYPETQEKVFQEVDKILKKYNGKLTYDSLNEMEYMDMFINETLRLYPPAVVAERICTKNYRIPDSDAVIEKGNLVIIPIISLQRDETYFPNPEKFDPERFSPENKSKIPQYAFLPFGQGPRNCIGMRLALAEMKVAIAHLVHNFVLEPSDKTPIPMKFAKTAVLKPDGGMWLRIRQRN